MFSAHFSSDAPVFQGRALPDTGWVVGYAAIIAGLQLRIPMPAAIAMVSKRYRTVESPGWRVFSQRYLPEDHTDLERVRALYHHIVFALKYEGVNLSVFAALSRELNEQERLELVNIEPSGQYARRIWFLLEWVSGTAIPGKPDMEKKSYVLAVDPRWQLAVKGVNSPRHRVINNLPGTPGFCAMVSNTPKISRHLAHHETSAPAHPWSEWPGELVQRATFSLSLKDSRASFAVEGESPRGQRVKRWSQALANAGIHELSDETLLGLQGLALENARNLHKGYRTEGGFVGEHDPRTGDPLPDHLSARPEDLPDLMDGLLKTSQLLIDDGFPAVAAAAAVAFGFVFIHPFADGNGRVHRYLMHHVLAKKGYVPQGLVLPLSTAILDHLQDYRSVLEAHSHPLLDCMDWEETEDHNVRVTSESRDLYRFVDLTWQTEFLIDCLQDTWNRILPAELTFLSRFDAFKRFIAQAVPMPEKQLTLLVNFLGQTSGRLSLRARTREFSALTDAEVERIEKAYRRIFLS